MFSFGKKYFLGIDIGTSSIKIIELELGGAKPVLSNYGWVNSENFAKEGGSSALWKKYITKILKEGKFKGKNAYVSVPSSGSLVTLIDFPEMEKDDMDQAIRFEAHKYVPVPLEEVVLSWDVVGFVGDEKEKKPNPENVSGSGPKEIIPGRKAQVLLVAAPKNKVAKYEEITKESGLNLKSMEIEGFSMVRSLIGNDQGNFLIVDIGARACNIILTEKGVIKVNRNIYSGGADITRVIAKSIDVEESKAESLKTKGDNFLSGELAMTFPSMEVILGEIKRMVEAYYKNNEKRKIDGLIISGGTANLKGIAEYFQSSLGVKVIIGNPLSRIEYPKSLELKLNEIKTRFSVAIGLALKGVEESLKK